jgi:hypothetical protein
MAAKAAVMVFFSNRGQAILESVAALGALLIVGAMLAHFAFYAGSSELLRFAGYETLICMLEINNPPQCHGEGQRLLSYAIGHSRPYIRAQGVGRQQKSVDLSYRPEASSGRGSSVESLHMTLSTQDLLK